jgi:hypothetical protein
MRIRHVIDGLPFPSPKDQPTLQPLQTWILIGLHTTFSYSDVLQGSVDDDRLYFYWPHAGNAPLQLCLFITSSGNLTDGHFNIASCYERRDATCEV